MNWKLEIGDNAGNQVAAPITVKEISISQGDMISFSRAVNNRINTGSISMTLECDPDVMKQITDYYFPDDTVRFCTSDITVKPESNSASFNIFNNAFLTSWQFYLSDEETYEVNATWKFSGKETVLTLPNELEPQPWVEGVWDEPFEIPIPVVPDTPDIPPFWETAPTFSIGAAKKEKPQLDWRRFGF